jgi:hypothetical protein
MPTIRDAQQRTLLLKQIKAATPTTGASPSPLVFFDLRSVCPARTIAGASLSSPGGIFSTTWLAHATRCASNASRSTCRKTVWSVAAQGGVWVKPRACAVRVPSWRPYAALSL